jgi:hypothetical protein
MTTINAAASVPYRPDTTKGSSDGVPAKASKWVIAGLSDVKPLSPDVAKPRSLLDHPTFDFLASLPLGTASDDVSKIWGNIEIGGKVVAQIFSSGVISGKTGYELPATARDIGDPAGRARAMIEAYGGKLVTRDQMKNPQLFLG